jgi:hypothetical protein
MAVAVQAGLALSASRLKSATPLPSRRRRRTRSGPGELALQLNFNNGGGLSDQTYFNLNIQPVIPIHLTQDWTLIARTIIPGYSPASGRRGVAQTSEVIGQGFFERTLN